jgi:hypothetical protein
MCDCLPYIQYKCNRRGCEYKRKYSKKNNLNVYVSFFNSVHCHEKRKMMIGTLVVSRTSRKVLSKTLSPGVFSPREIQNTSFVQNGLQRLSLARAV